jgi:hypothetical protein
MAKSPKPRVSAQALRIQTQYRPPKKLQVEGLIAGLAVKPSIICHPGVTRTACHAVFKSVTCADLLIFSRPPSDLGAIDLTRALRLFVSTTRPAVHG